MTNKKLPDHIEDALCRVAHRDHTKMEPTEEHDANLLREYISSLYTELDNVKEANRVGREQMVLANDRIASLSRLDDTRQAQINTLKEQRDELQRRADSHERICPSCGEMMVSLDTAEAAQELAKSPTVPQEVVQAWERCKPTNTECYNNDSVLDHFIRGEATDA